MWALVRQLAQTDRQTHRQTDRESPRERERDREGERTREKEKVREREDGIAGCALVRQANFKGGYTHVLCAHLFALHMLGIPTAISNPKADPFSKRCT